MFYRITTPFPNRFCMRCGSKLAVIVVGPLINSGFDMLSGEEIIPQVNSVIIACTNPSKLDRGHAMYGGRLVEDDDTIADPSTSTAIYSDISDTQPDDTQFDWLPDLNSI